MTGVSSAAANNTSNMVPIEALIAESVASTVFIAAHPALDPVQPAMILETGWRDR
jgi:hypothetical protein